MPTINLGRVGFVQKGIHSLLTPYKVNDVVTSDGQVYACILANTGEALSNDVYWSPWVTPAGIISDEAPLTTKAYSGAKTQLLHDIQAEAISNLATASGRIGSESSPVFSPIPLVLTDMPFQVLTDSTDTNVIEFDAVANTITLKINASFNFLSNVTFTSATSAERTITFALIDTSDDSVVTTEVGTFDFSLGVTTVVPFNTLLTLGKNGMPEAPLTIKVQAIASGSGYILNNFSSILASSSAYDSATTDASTVIVTPSGSIASTNVQDALQELDTEKAINSSVIHTTGDESKSGILTFTSIPKAPKANKGDNTTSLATTSFVYEGLTDKINISDINTYLPAPTPQVRQTVLKGNVDTSGFSAFGGSTGSTTVTASSTLIATCADGTNDRIGTIVNPSWTGLSTNGTRYLYLDIATDGTCTTGSTTLAPTYRWGGADVVTNLQNTFNIQEMKMKVGNGSTASQVYRVFVGEVTVASSVVSAIVWYALMGRYESEVTTLLTIQTQYNFNNNIGVNNIKAIGYAYCKIAEFGYSVGDRVYNADDGNFGTGTNRGGLLVVTNKNTTSITVANSVGAVNKTTGLVLAGGFTIANWGIGIMVERGW